MRGGRAAAAVASKGWGSNSLIAVGFIVAVPVFIFGYLLSQPQAPVAERRTTTVYRYDVPTNVSWAQKSTLSQIYAAIRTATNDSSISRLVTMSGVRIKKPSSIPAKCIALDDEEHFYWPYVADGHAHDLSTLKLDRDVRLIARSRNPRVYEIENFLSHAECDEIVKLGQQRGLEASPLILSEKEKGIDWSNARTSTGVFVEQWAYPNLQRIAERVANLTRIPPRYSESMQVIHYNKEQHYWAHYDWVDNSVPVDSWPARAAGGIDNRYVTILFYLNDVPKGGYTTFPRSNPMWNEQIGYNERICDESFASLKVYPKKGNAVMFYDVPAHGQRKALRDDMSLHVMLCAGCDPVDSEKWAANFWIHLKPMRDEDAPQTYCVGEGCNTPHAH